MDKEQCLQLIKLYGEYRRLWDAHCPDYTNRGLREDAWRNISQEMNIPIVVLKKKMDSLLGSFRREKSRERKSRITGSGRGEIYTSNWYAYEAFSFLGDRNHPGNTQDTSTLNEENASQNNTQNDEGTIETSNSTTTVEPKQKSTTRSKKRSKTNETDDLTDNAISEALTLLQKCASDNAVSEKKDSYDIYGQYIANELRKYDNFTLANVKNAINKIIFEADMGAYSGYYTSYSGHDISKCMYRPSSLSTPSTSSMPATSPMPHTSSIFATSPMPTTTSVPATSPMATTSSVSATSPMPNSSSVPATSPLPTTSPLPATSPMRTILSMLPLPPPYH